MPLVINRYVMPNYPQYEQQFAQDLINALGKQEENLGLSTLLTALIDALPYYSDNNWLSLHRSTLLNLLQVNLPNEQIEPHPMEYGFGYVSSYFYRGSYSGYQNAFFSGILPSPLGTKVANAVAAVNPGFNYIWWGKYSVAVLSDSIRVALNMNLDTKKLSSDLNNFATSFNTALAASCWIVNQYGFAPTANAFAAIANNNYTATALTELTNAIINQQFTADINHAISMGGESTTASIWFLFNLWLTLNILGGNVDDIIRQAQNAGLQVPVEIGPVNWRSGSYAYWFNPLNGNDMLPSANATIQAPMPETWVFSAGTPYPSYNNITQANGYSISLCNWGKLNWYKPGDGSCFGAKTQVLMADGQSKTIAEICIGDMVMSSAGPCKVALIETPPRKRRPLYQVNEQQVFATSAHPFCMAETASPKLAAIDPWALIDGIPTTTIKGVVDLKPGINLKTNTRGQDTESMVAHLIEHPSYGDVEEDKVYDLILESWVKKQAAYYVGGPDHYFAVEAETIDPLPHPNAAAGVIACLHQCLMLSRKKLSFPYTQISNLIAMACHQGHVKGIRSMNSQQFDAELKLPKIPGVEIFLHNGEWDIHASMLEYHIAKRFGRLFRRESATGWRNFQSSQPAGILVLTIFDLELGGHVNLNKEIQLKIELVTSDHGIIQNQISLSQKGETSYHSLIDRCLDFGNVNMEIANYQLSIALQNGEKELGKTSLELSKETIDLQSFELSLADPNGYLLGRIGIECHCLQEGEFREALLRKEQWGMAQTLDFATRLGTSLGQELARNIISRHPELSNQPDQEV